MMMLTMNCSALCCSGALAFIRSTRMAPLGIGKRFGRESICNHGLKASASTEGLHGVRLLVLSITLGRCCVTPNGEALHLPPSSRHLAKIADSGTCPKWPWHLANAPHNSDQGHALFARFQFFVPCHNAVGPTHHCIPPSENYTTSLGNDGAKFMVPSVVHSTHGTESAELVSVGGIFTWEIAHVAAFAAKRSHVFHSWNQEH